MPGEERRFPRISARTTVLVESLDPDGTEELARTRSVGRGGCGFLSPAPLAPGTALQMLISVGRDVVKARAHVVYSHETPRGHEVGVEFVQLTPEDEVVLARLVEEGDGAD